MAAVNTSLSGPNDTLLGIWIDFQGYLLDSSQVAQVACLSWLNLSSEGISSPEKADKVIFN